MEQKSTRGSKTHRKYGGLSAAKAELKAARLELERTGGEKTCLLMGEVEERIKDSVATITKVAIKSRNLKGTFVRDLNEAAAMIRLAFASLTSRFREENKGNWQADYEGLKKENADLRNRLAKLEKRGPEMTGNDLEELRQKISREVMIEAGTMVSARLAVLEERLPPEKRLRPPLAADRKREEEKPIPIASETVKLVTSKSVTSRAQSMTNNVTKEKTKGKKKKTNKTEESPREVEPLPLPPAPANMEEGWNVVVRKGKKKKKEKEKEPAPHKKHGESDKSNGKGTRKLWPPRSAAVVVTLQSDAAARGITYSKVLAEAKSRIALQELGIAALKFKVAATGARILEVPGRDSAGQADALANKLREVLGEDAVRVARPTKCVEVRVTDLDDSTSSDDIVQAIATAGGCSPDLIKVNSITRNREGIGTAWARCPIGSAKKIVETGRILVGWMSARIKLLEERPRRCFRCLEMGHLRARCTSRVDRSEECYRCGQSQHKASQCTATPHCNLCAGAGHPAEHRMGGKSCAPSSKGRNERRKADDDGPRVPSPQAKPATGREEESRMAIDP